MRTSPFPVLLALAFAPSFALFGCGGAGGSSAKAPTASNDGGAAGASSIGDLALAKGGLASLGGAGNREEDAPPAAVLDTFRLDLVEPKARVKIDGVLGEWPARISAQTLVKGPGDATAFAAAMQYDDAKIYVAGEVAEKNFVRTTSYGENEDHASLVLAFPSGGTFVAYEIGLFAGKEGDIPGDVRFLAGGQGEVPGARIVEAKTGNGYSFEAVIPWSAFPEARTVRVGLRGVARYYDADGGGIRTIVATGSGSVDTPKALPYVPTETEQSIIDGLLIPKQLSQTPKAELFVDVAGDAMKERVAVYDRYFTICGPSYRGGKEFFFRDLAADLVTLDGRDVTGRGKDDLLVRRRFNVPGREGATREWFEVWSLSKGDEPTTTFAHEIAVVSGTKRIANAVRVSPREIEVTLEPAQGWDAATYTEPQSTDVEPVLLPWGPVKSQLFHFDAGKFGKAREVAQTPTGAPAMVVTSPTAPAGQGARTPEPKTPAVTRGGDLSRQLFDQYKTDKGLAPDTKARVDLEVQVDGDARPERVLLVGRDLVVFGPGFRGGTRYGVLTLQQFSDPADITDVSARDLTGDGAADLVVRGKRHVTAPATSDPVDLEAMFVYEVKAGQITRIFAIETAREQGDKRVQGLVQFVPARGGKAFEIDVRPGVAKGWTEKTFPWKEDKPGAAIEPLLLPWGKTGSLRYAYNGAAYVPR